MKVLLSEVLSLYTKEDVEAFLHNKTEFNNRKKMMDPNEQRNFWRFVGENPSNASIIHSLKKSEKGLIERITNAIDAVIEKEKSRNNLTSARNAEVIVRKAFPRFYDNRRSILEGHDIGVNAYEAADKVVVVVNDSSIASKPTIDVIDQGIGIQGNRFSKTILSLNGDNKITTDKEYSIGTFGQGGSTSLAFADSTLIISKFDSKYHFTIVKCVEIDGYKNYVYVYLTDDGNIISLVDNHTTSDHDHLEKFLKSESGTLVRMIETELPREFRSNDVTKPGMLGDLINSELFNVSIPVKIIENRKQFELNQNHQNRNSFGSYIKLHTWKYMKKEFSGSINIEFNNCPYTVEYFAILPIDDSKWVSDSECKEIFRQVNVHLSPIIYTVNGQYVSGEYFTKLKNAGLSFLQYRLLVVINLDVLGKEKYRFLTTDRSQIREIELTKGFIDEVIKGLKNEESILYLNSLIMKNSISSKLSGKNLDEVSNRIKELYQSYLSYRGEYSNQDGGNKKRNDGLKKDYLDHIEELRILNSKDQYYYKDVINIFLYTGARKEVNSGAKIYAFLNDESYPDFDKSVMNERLQYSLTGLQPGKYEIEFYYFENEIDNIKSNKYEFYVINEENPDMTKKYQAKFLNIRVDLVQDKELIVDVVRNETEKSIQINVCENHPKLASVYGKSNTEKITRFKNLILAPMTYYALVLDKIYDNIDDPGKKNEIILAFLNAQFMAFLDMDKINHSEEVKTS